MKASEEAIPEADFVKEKTLKKKKFSIEQPELEQRQAYGRKH
jgi:hypothetical protein